MKRLLLILVLVAIIYVLGVLTYEEIGVYRNNASLILSGIDKSKIIKTVKNHFNETILTDGNSLDDSADIILRLEYINDDTLKDIVATVKSSQTCGSGGCITTIYLQNEFGGFESINFIYAVKDIIIEPSITNQMHDITINGAKGNIMTWDGVRYVLNAL